MAQGQGEAPRGGRPGTVVVTLVLSLVAVACAYGAALLALRPPSPGTELTLDDVTRYATCASTVTQGTTAVDAKYCAQVNRRIDTATFLDEDARLTGTVVDADGGDPSDFWASYPKSDAATGDLIRTLSFGRTKVVIDPQTARHVTSFLAQYVLPLIMLATLFALLFHFVQRPLGGAAEYARFGRAGNRRIAASARPATTFADVAAADEAVAELTEIRDYLVDRRAYLDIGALPPKGVLLVGPPGCGKTLLARAVAGEADAAFFSMSGSEFVESLVGVGAARVRDLFAQARATAPAIVFIDELDAVGRQRGAGVGQGHDEREQTLNELLVQMDGFSTAEGLMVLAATNRPDILDTALLRAGRFDRHVTVERPDAAGRLAILRLHARGRRLADAEADLPYIARITAGFTGADLANLLNEAALLTVRDRSETVGRGHLEEAVERVLSGPRRRGQVLSDEERRWVAYHEAGHAVVAAGVGLRSSLQKLSIVARGRGIGHLAVLRDDRDVVRKSDLEARIAIAAAGFVVEELVFGETSTGSEQDVERVSKLSRELAGRFGMSESIGSVRVLADERETFLGRDYLATRDVAPPTLEQLDSEVRRIVDEQKLVARSILAAHRGIVDALAAELVARETLSGPDLENLLGDVHPRIVATASAG